MPAEPIEDAWIGDAVLTLFVRSMILKEDGRVDGPKSVRMTSNQFLGGKGQPTRVEAEIGKTYREQGLSAAFEWIDRELMPLFRKQEETRARKTLKSR